MLKKLHLDRTKVCGLTHPVALLLPGAANLAIWDGH